jgi:phosphoribosylaminoimidazole-succinocarboxamide synthase
MSSFTIDGGDNCGKSTVIALLNDHFQNLKLSIKDRGVLTMLTDVYEDDLPKALPPNDVIIVLDADVEVCMKRMIQRQKPRDEYDTFEAIFKYKNRFMRLVIKYGTYYVDTTHLTKEQVFDCVAEIIGATLNNKSLANYQLPNPDDFTPEMFSKLPLVAEGYSKIIRAVNDQFTLIEYKPTVYSHKQRREGVIPFTDQERMRMTKNILYILEKEQIPHAYVYVGDKYVLCRRLHPKKDIPPVEVIVKKCNEGTDKYRYHWLDHELDRYGKPIITNDNREYSDLVVRFDYRNPNHVYIIKVKQGTKEIYFAFPHYKPEPLNEFHWLDSIIIQNPFGENITINLPNYLPEDIVEKFKSALNSCRVNKNPDDDMIDIVLHFPHYIPSNLEEELKRDPNIFRKPIGDECMCDDLADKFINVAEAKKLALRTFRVLDKHFEKMGIYFQDVCFMILRDGSAHYSEISQDCGRYKKIEKEGTMTALDKDVFRSGGSSALVHEKWREMTKITKEYVQGIYNL